MMRSVAINGRFLTQRVTGVQRVAIELILALDALLAERAPEDVPSFELLVPPGFGWTHRPLGRIRVRCVGRLSGHPWEQFELPLAAGNRVLVNLCNTYPLLAWRPIVMIHDAAVYAVPGGYTRAFAGTYRLLFNALKLRPRVPLLTNSVFSATELQRWAGLPASRMDVVSCGADHWDGVVADDTALVRLGLRQGGYVLCVASQNPNKNLVRLVDAFGRMRDAAPDPGAGPQQLRLVLVGGRDSRVFSDSTLPDPPWMVRAGPVSDAELAGLFRGASCFAFPSLYEGFGLPPLEAMTFGCPVLVSREASLPEVCGDAALYCDGRDAEDIAASLFILISDAELRSRLISAGHRRITLFRWRAVAARALERIREYAA